MATLNLNYSKKIKNIVMSEQAQKIKSLFSDVAKDVNKKAKLYEGLENTSSVLRAQQLRELETNLNLEIGKITEKVENGVYDSVKKVSNAVVDDNNGFIKGAGFRIQKAFSHVPTEIINRIMQGKIYDKEWFLSTAIWNDIKKKQSDISSIIAKGITENKSTYDIAKDLEKYVDPGFEKPWNWSKVYPGTSKVIDYNCQRLARTLINHSYQQALVLTTKHNPFVKGIKWISALIHSRTCQLCTERHGKIFKKEELPADHPNGLCTFAAEIPDSMEDIADRIADWYKGKDDPELDTFSKSMTNSIF